MKTIYLSIILTLATSLPLQSQALFNETVAPYTASNTAIQEDFSFAGNLNNGTTYYTPFSMQSAFSSDFTPAEDWLTNNFGANYSSAYDDWLSIPHGSPDSALKIPVGNGTTTILLIIGLYGLVIIIRKRLRISRFA